MGREQLVVATPLRRGFDEPFLELLAEMRERRDEVGASRRRVGFTRMTAWYQKGAQGSHSIVCFEGADPSTSLEKLLASDHPFDVDLWGRMQPMFARTKPSERLRHRRRIAVDEEQEIVQYIALAVTLVPGKVDEIRRLATMDQVHGDDEDRYLRLLGLQEMTIWLQEVPWGHVVIYFSSGDVAQSTEVLATSDDPAIVADRAFVRDFYGIDLTVENMPVPQPTFAWSDLE